MSKSKKAIITFVTFITITALAPLSIYQSPINYILWGLPLSFYIWLGSTSLLIPLLHFWTKQQEGGKQ